MVNIMNDLDCAPKVISAIPRRYRSLLSCGVKVCLSHWCIVSKRLNLPSDFFIACSGPIILVFQTVKFRRNHPQQERQIEVWVPKICDFQAISHCISETMRDGARYHGTLIGNHRRFIEPTAFSVNDLE